MTSGQDKTVRLWKVTTESQLLYRGGPTASMDCVSMLSDQKFIGTSQGYPQGLLGLYQGYQGYQD